MGLVIHARRSPENTILYRLWSTISDAYATDVLTEEELREALLEDAKHRAQRMIDEAVHEANYRIERANTYGTSERVFAIDDLLPSKINGPWNTERCEHCGGFHHDFVPQPECTGHCNNCGEAANEAWHTLPCPREKKT